MAYMKQLIEDICWNYYDGLSVEEISDELGVDVNDVRLVINLYYESITV